MSGKGVAIGVLVILVLTSIIVPVTVMYAPGGEYPTYYWHIDQAWDLIDLANDTNNLTQVAGYLDQAAAQIVNYHGNPQWPYPTANTNFDLIRANMLSTAETCLGYAHNGTTAQSFGFGAIINQIHNTLHNLKQALDDTESYTTFSLGSSVGTQQLEMLIGLICMWVIGLLALLAYYSKFE